MHRDEILLLCYDASSFLITFLSCFCSHIEIRKRHANGVFVEIQ